MIHLLLTPLPTVPSYPVSAVVPHNDLGWTVYAGHEALPTINRPCITVGNRSTEVFCFVTPEQHQRGLTVKPGGSETPLLGEPEADEKVVKKIIYALADALDSDGSGPQSQVHLNPIGFGAFELSVIISNGDVMRPHGHRRVDLTSVQPPEGWSFVPLDSRKIDSPFTLHQGGLWTWRVLVCPTSQLQSAEAWAWEAGRAFAVDDDGVIVTPRANGMAWPKLAEGVVAIADWRALQWLSQHRQGIPKTVGEWPYGKDVAGSEGEQDPEGQPYGGKTGGQDFEWFVEEMASFARFRKVGLHRPAFQLLVDLDEAIRDRCLHLTRWTDPLDVINAPGFTFNVSAENGAKLYSKKAGDIFGFFSAPDDPGTSNRQHGSVDWQHGSMRQGAIEMLATLWNDELAKQLIQIEAAMGRTEMPDPKSKGMAIGRAEFWCAQAQCLEHAFFGEDGLSFSTSPGEDWFRSKFIPALNAVQRQNGGICGWLNKEADYALDYLSSSSGLPVSNFPRLPVSRPEQEVICLSALWRGLILGFHEAYQPAQLLLFWIAYVARHPTQPSPWVRVGLNGERMDEKTESWYYRHLLAIVVTAAKRWPILQPLAQNLLGQHTGVGTKMAWLEFFGKAGKFENAAGLVGALR